MLVLNRRVGEKIRIGEDIVITLTSVRGGKDAKIGIDAPRDLRVLREEIHEVEKYGYKPVPVTT